MKLQKSRVLRSSWLLWSAWLLVISVHCQEQHLVLRITRSLRVARGSSVYIQPEDVLLNTAENVPCKIKVDVDSNLRLSVGEVHPQVFACNFQRNFVHYVHDGNPLVHVDLIRLVIYYFDPRETMAQVVHLSIFIDPPDDLIFADSLSLKPLVVDGSNSSNIIDASVLRFRYAFFDEAICTVTSYEPGYQSQSLLAGSLVANDGIILSNISLECRDFLTAGLRYKHNGVSTTVDDYIMLHAEVEEMHEGSWRFKSENIFLPVHILSGIRNSAPRLSVNSSDVIEAEQFSLLILSSDVFWFTDDETPAKDLVINVTKPVLFEEEGFFVHIRDQWQPIRAFRQDDLANRRIAYHPPSTIPPPWKQIEVQLFAIDNHFIHSDPVSLHITVRPVRTTSPKVTLNAGLTVIQGKSQALTRKNFQLVDSDNINDVELHVRGGPYHGTLTVYGRPSPIFKINDMEQGNVLYAHNGGNSVEDKLILRITDRKNTIRMRLMITILTNGIASPVLSTNRSLEVFKDRYALITPHHLSATHPHVSSNDIMFEIKFFPRNGKVMKLHHPLSVGYPVSVFSQRDLVKGNIWFYRTASEHFDEVDRFKFALSIRGWESNNVTRLHLFEIKIRRYLVNRPPQTRVSTAMRLELNETDVIRITKSMLSFEDPEKPSDIVFYTITCSPYFTGNPVTLEAGRIVAVDDATTLTKNLSSSSIHSFTQTMINRRMLAYVPPMEDIGPDLVHVQFIFSVSDQLGNSIRNQRFNITVFPVNDRIPQMSVQPIRVREGGSVVLNSQLIIISDVDTRLSNLVLTLWQRPEYGHIAKGDRNLVEGDSFGADELNRSSVRYVHGGSQNLVDVFVVSISDGAHTLTKSVPVTTLLLSKSSIHPSVSSPVVIQVDEGREATIKTDDLQSQTINARNTSSLIYDIIRSPLYGHIRVNGVSSSRFLNADLVAGAVRYCHTAGEIGQEPVQDSAVFMVSREGSDKDYSLLELTFLVTPIDNAPPQLMLGSPLLVGEGKTARLTSEVISAWDLDSHDNNLVFVVSQLPVWGSLVKTRSTRSERSNSRNSVSSFSMSDLKEGAVQYVQSSLPEGGPASDSFFIYATDGKQNSTPGKVEVTVMKHSKEESAELGFEVDDITVDEGGEKVVNIRLGRAAVRSKSELILALAESPRHGQVILVMSAHQNNGIKEVVLREVAVSGLSGVQVVYQHDGSETSSDRFVLSVTSGLNTVRRAAHVRVVPVNDARPGIIRNDILRVKFGRSEIISDFFLKAVDADNPDGHVKYIVVSPPRKGLLELKQTDPTNSVWLELMAGETFTQSDVNSGRLQYTHTKSVGELAKDNFIFQLTDGKNFVSHETFEIEIVRPESETVIMHNHEMFITAGTTKAITSDMLSLIDSSLNSENIRYFITTPPVAGLVKIYSNSTGGHSPASIFSQSDLDLHVVSYSHVLNMTAKNDSFVFSVKGPRNQIISSGVFQIQIHQNSSISPTLEVNVPLMVIHGNQAAMTSSNLRIAGHEIPPENLIYTIAEAPRHGKILINEAVVSNFTQNDLDDGSVFYQSNSTDESMMDYFLFTISYRVAGESPVNSTVETKPQFFSILIQPISKIAPTVELVRPLVNLIALSGEQYGFVVTNEHLRSVHPLFDANDIVYYIRDKPKSGYFENRGTKRTIKKRFSQKDVDDERIIFVLNDEVHVTNDSVLFRITDPNRNSVDGFRLEMHWSLIEWSKSQYIVCEDIHLLPLVIHRRGSTNQSAAVQIRTKQMSAKEKLDYLPRSNGTVVFPPGATKVNWMVEVINDGLTEGKEEKFKVILRNATNAILGPIDKTIVQLTDYEDGQCTEYIGMISKNKKDGLSMAEVQDFPSTNNTRERPEVPSLFGFFDQNEDLSEEYDYDEYFDRVEDPLPTLLESDLSFYNGGNQEGTTKSSLDTGNRRKSGPGKDSWLNGGSGKALNSPVPQKPKTGKGRSSSNQKSKNRFNIPQPCMQETKGLLYFDLQTSKMFRCSGDQWQLWNWRATGKISTMMKDSTSEPEDGEMLKMENFMSFRDEDHKTFCPTGWTSYNNSCFMASSGRLNWVDAEAACQREAAHLTHIQSRDHLAWLWSLNDQSQFWTGLHKKSEAATWQYTDSTPARYYNWRNNYPCTKCRYNQCVVVGIRKEFMNKSCDKVKMKYICVQSPRPTRRSATRH